MTETHKTINIPALRAAVDHTAYNGAFVQVMRLYETLDSLSQEAFVRGYQLGRELMRPSEIPAQPEWNGDEATGLTQGDSGDEIAEENRKRDCYDPNDCICGEPDLFPNCLR